MGGKDKSNRERKRVDQKKDPTIVQSDC